MIIKFYNEDKENFEWYIEFDKEDTEKEYVNVVMGSFGDYEYSVKMKLANLVNTVKILQGE